MQKSDNLLCEEPGPKAICCLKKEPCVITVTAGEKEIEYYPNKETVEKITEDQEASSTSTTATEPNTECHDTTTASVAPTPETREPSVLLSPTLPRRKKKKRHVHFPSVEADVVCIVKPRDDLTADEMGDIWWTSAEFNGIRLGAKYLTKDVRTRDKALVAGIEECYARALHLSCSLSDQDFEDLVINCKRQAVCLRPWCERSLSARGLERYTSRKHRYDRTEYAMETRAAVLRLAKNNTVSQEELSVFYQEYSRSALLYARFCGEADRSAAKDHQRSNSTSRRRNRTTSSSMTSSAAPSSDASVPTESSSESTASSCAALPVSMETRRDILQKSQEHSRGRLLVQELSQRRLEATTAV